MELYVSCGSLEGRDKDHRRMLLTLRDEEDVDDLQGRRGLSEIPPEPITLTLSTDYTTYTVSLVYEGPGHWSWPGCGSMQLRRGLGRHRPVEHRVGVMRASLPALHVCHDHDAAHRHRNGDILVLQERLQPEDGDL